MPKRKGYGQFCPVARAAEVVAERWTPLVLRELLLGSRRFNDLRRGVPLMSASLLSLRLKELENVGVVRRTELERGKGYSYELTESGAELGPVIDMLGLWGNKWIRRELSGDELDPSLLLWDIRRRVDLTKMPAAGRVVIQFDLEGAPHKKSRWWLVVDRGEIDLCLVHPGTEPQLSVASNVKALSAVWLGNRDLPGAIRNGEIRLQGSAPLAKSFAKWFGLSSFAHLGRTAPA
jgi:DNA-binding HxlR family transcriptional regulator